MSLAATWKQSTVCLCQLEPVATLTLHLSWTQECIEAKSSSEILMTLFFLMGSLSFA